MFEFLESKANELIDSINSTANGMSSDSEAATTQATDNESQASQLEAQAAAEEASCPHYKEETRTVTVDDGDGKSHTETETETVPDPAADASSRAKASALRAQAATLKAAAAALRALASALRAQFDAIKAQRQRFADAVSAVNEKISDTTYKLEEGTSLIAGVINTFSVPIISGAVNMTKNTVNSILGNIGIDLSDGFDENDVYGLTGWIAQTTVDTGAMVVKSFVSTTVASALGGGVIGATGAFIVGKIVGPTIDEAFGDKAVEGVHTFLTSALGFLGIKAKPDEEEIDSFEVKDVNDSFNTATEQANISLEFDTVKSTAKELYKEYLNKFNYTDEKKQFLIEKYNKAIDETVVLSDEEFNKKFRTGEETLAIYNGPDDRAYIRESESTRVDIIVHEVGGHGTGSMIPSELEYYDKNGNWVYYFKDSFGTNLHAMDEATTELFARQIRGKQEDIAYNVDTDVLEKICTSMEKYGICNGFELLNDTYTGEDKYLFAQKYNEILTSVSSDSSRNNYQDLCECMEKQLNSNSIGDKVVLDLKALTFEQACKRYSEEMKS